MDLLLSVHGDDSDRGLERLDGWLRAEPELRGQVARRDREPVPGEMGALADALSVAVSAGGTLTVLAASLKVYLARPRGSTLKIRIRTREGDSVEIDAERVHNVEAVLQDLLGLED